MNLQQLKKGGRRPAAGDVFELQTIDGTKMLGRVIGANLVGVREAPMEGSNLIYIFDPDRWAATLPTRDVQPEDLLVAPIYTNQRPWTHGYFRKISSSELSQSDRLAQHCFWDGLRDTYVDESHERLPAKVEPCGVWGLVSTEWIDDRVSDALGIPRAPL